MQVHRILTDEEIRHVLDHLDGLRTRRRRKESNSDILTRTIFRLACCCGMRRKEISLVQLRDFNFAEPRPIIRVRPEATKRSAKRATPHGRIIPLWWDSETKSDLRRWYDLRVAMTPDMTAPFVCSLRVDHLSQPLSPDAIAAQWERLIANVLGNDRAAQVSIHDGRHSFCSHAIHRGRSLLEVRDAAGHTNVATTNIYAHAIESDCGDLFGRERQ